MRQGQGPNTPPGVQACPVSGGDYHHQGHSLLLFLTKVGCHSPPLLSVPASSIPWQDEPPALTSFPCTCACGSSPFLDQPCLLLCLSYSCLHQWLPSPVLPHWSPSLCSFEHPHPQSESVPFVLPWVPLVPGLGLSPCRLGDPLANVSHTEFWAGQGLGWS